MRMMLTGAGAVGECILKMLEKRDPKGEWLSYVLLADFDLKRADEVKSHLEQERKYREGTQYETAQVDARDREALTALMREHRIDFVMDAASPFVSNFIFDAAFEAGADYASMGTWSVPKDHPDGGFESGMLMR